MILKSTSKHMSKPRALVEYYEWLFTLIAMQVQSVLNSIRITPSPSPACTYLYRSALPLYRRRTHRPSQRTGYHTDPWHLIDSHCRVGHRHIDRYCHRTTLQGYNACRCIGGNNRSCPFCWRNGCTPAVCSLGDSIQRTGHLKQFCFQYSLLISYNIWSLLYYIIYL